MFTRINHILPDALKKNGLTLAAAKTHAFSIFEEHARKILPLELASSFKPLRLVSGTLTVACKSSSVATLLYAAKEELLAALVEARVEYVRFLLAPWR